MAGVGHGYDLLFSVLIIVVNILIICCKYIFWHGNCFFVKVLAGYCKHPNYLLFLLSVNVVNILLICCKCIFFGMKIVVFVKILAGYCKP
jgi:hypothetical protein